MIKMMFNMILSFDLNSVTVDIMMTHMVNVFIKSKIRSFNEQLIIWSLDLTVPIIYIIVYNDMIIDLK